MPADLVEPPPYTGGKQYPGGRSMGPVQHYDILVLGGGKGGKTLAMDQAKAGKKVGMVEVGMIGGACLNIPSDPAQALVRSAQVADTVRRGAAFGVITPEPAIDMARVAARTADVVAGMVEYNRQAFHKSGLELIL